MDAMFLFEHFSVEQFVKPVVDSTSIQVQFNVEVEEPEKREFGRNAHHSRR